LRWRALLNPWVKRERIEVLKELSLTLHFGEVTGLVGVNGVGKSTLMRLLSGLLLADKGELRVLDLDPQRRPEAVQRQLGVVLPNERSFFWRLSLRRNLEFFARLSGLDSAHAVERAEDTARQLGVSAELDKPFRELSDGQKQRAAVARGLLHPSRLLLVDEATRSLDPAGAERVRRLLRDYADRGGAVLLVSHNLDEIAAIGERLLLLEDGRIQEDGPPSEIGPRVRERLDALEQAR